MLASCMGGTFADSSFHVMALAEHALADIPLQFLTLAKLFSSVPIALNRLGFVDSMK